MRPLPTSSAAASVTLQAANNPARLKSNSIAFIFQTVSAQALSDDWVRPSALYVCWLLRLTNWFCCGIYDPKH